MKFKEYVRKNDNLVIVYLIFAVFLIIGSAVSPRFLTAFNFGNIMEQAVCLGIVALGQVLVILIGGIDLSVGAVVSLGTAMMSLELGGGALPVVFKIVLTLLAGMGVGLFNGLGIVRLKIPPFIMTLATMSIVSGIALKIRPVPGGDVPYSLTEVLFGRLLIFPYAVLIWILLLAMLVWVMGSRRFGRNLYAVGGSATTAELSGISVSRVTMTAHILCGAVASIAGICVAARMGTGDSTLGSQFGMDSITVCVLAGFSLSGGQGNVLGLLASTMIFSCISNVLNLTGVSSYFQYVFKGLILLITILVFSVKDRRKMQ